MQEGLLFVCRAALKSAARGFSRRHGERNGPIPTAAVKLATGLDFKRRYGIIKTDEPRTLDFSGVRGFLVTNVCIVQRSAV